MSEQDATVLGELLARERAALDQYYGKSDPSEYAALFADDATYFDPFTPGRVDGEAIPERFATYAGQIPRFRYEVLNPAVTLHGDAAVFTFNLETYDPTEGTVTSKWNTTEVHRRTDDGWEMVHAHWSPEPGS